MRKPIEIIAPGLAVALLLGSAAAAVGDSDWRLDPVWDDGKAEYCVYTVEWRRYGRTYSGSALLVLVKEPWAPDLEVKADRPRVDGFEVLKLNHVRDVTTGIYSYHQMASAFLRRDTGALRKLTASSTEACGISTAYLVDGILETRSYFDGEGERRMPYPRGALPEDALPALLRDVVRGPLPPRLEVVPTLLAGRFGDLSAVSHRVERGEPQPVEIEAGSFSGVELRLSGPAGTLTYIFDAQPPHLLLSHRSATGSRYQLAKCERLAYWRMTSPGDRGWLPAVAR